MTVLKCAGNCSRLISVSNRGGNPTALADPKHWAVDYVQCPSCGTAWCERCHSNLGSDRCLRCQQPFIHHIAIAGTAAIPPPSTSTAAIPRLRGWSRKREKDSQHDRGDPQPSPSAGNAHPDTVRSRSNPAQGSDSASESGRAIPSWWRHQPDEWPDFRDVLERTVKQRGDVVPPDESDTVTIRQVDGCTFDLPLDRLASYLHGFAVTQWAPKMAEYFADQRAQAEIIRQELLAQGFDAVRSLLRPRLLTRGLLSSELTPFRRGQGADLVALLAVEGPQTSHWLAAEDVAAWGVTVDELWRIAFSNLRREDHEVKQSGLFWAVRMFKPGNWTMVRRTLLASCRSSIRRASV